MASPHELVLTVASENTDDSLNYTTYVLSYLINFYNVVDMQFLITTIYDKETPNNIIKQTYNLNIKFNGDNGEEIYGESFAEENQPLIPAPTITPTANQTALQNLYDAFKVFAPAL